MFRAHDPIQTITVSNTLANCDPIIKEAFSSGSLQLPVNTTVTDLTVYASLDDGESWGAARDDYGNTIVIPVTTSATDPAFASLPDACFKYPRLKLKADVGADDEEALVFLIS